MTTHIFSGPLSMFGAKVQIAALEKGIAFELVMVPFDRDDNYSPKHPEVLRINPKGQVPVLIDTVAASRAQFGRIKPLAVTSAKAMTALPEIRPVAEQGLEGFSVVAWNALMAPRGTPVEVRERLAAEMRKILALPETAKALHELGFEPAPPMDYAQLVAWLRSERLTDAEIIRSAGMKAD